MPGEGIGTGGLQLRFHRLGAREAGEGTDQQAVGTAPAGDPTVLRRNSVIFPAKSFEGEAQCIAVGARAYLHPVARRIGGEQRLFLGGLLRLGVSFGFRFGLGCCVGLFLGRRGCLLRLVGGGLPFCAAGGLKRFDLGQVYSGYARLTFGFGDVDGMDDVGQCPGRLRIGLLALDGGGGSGLLRR